MQLTGTIGMEGAKRADEFATSAIDESASFTWHYCIDHSSESDESFTNTWGWLCEGILSPSLRISFDALSLDLTFTFFLYVFSPLMDVFAFTHVNFSDFSLNYFPP